MTSYQVAERSPANKGGLSGEQVGGRQFDSQLNQAGKLISLQCTAGNQAVNRLIQRCGAERSSSLPPSSSPGPLYTAAGISDGIDLEGTSQELTDQVSRSPDAGTRPADAGAPAADAGTAVTNVTFGTVNAATTPAGMSARVPPRIDQSVAVTVTGAGSVTISVDGASATNGTATLNGAATANLSASGSIALRGTAQTAPGSAGNLRLAARAGGATVGTSNAFTISAIPTTVTISAGTPITGSERGVDVPTSNDSDSGQISDLDQVRMSEKVQYVNGSGCFAGITSGNNSGFLPANVSPHGSDHHGTPVALITGPGSIDSNQMFVFNDARSGATNVPVTNSGFNIHRQVTAAATDAGTGLSITTSKTAVATTVRGTSANAGSGSATSGPQPV
jgi:hypothetical protein